MKTTHIATLTFKTAEKRDATLVMLEAMIGAGFFPKGTTARSYLVPSFPDRNVVHVGSVRGVNAFSEMNDDDGVLRFRDTLWFDCSTDAKAYALFEMLRSLSSAGLLPNVRFSYQASKGKRVVFEVESDAVVKNRKAAERRRVRASR